MLQNRLFFALASRSGFGPAISDPVARSSIVFCSLCRSHSNGCVKVARKFRAVGRVGREVCSVKFKCGVRRAQCEVRSVKCEVWSVKEAVRSVKCGL